MPSTMLLLSFMWTTPTELENILRLPDKELKSLLRMLRKKGLVAQA